MCRVLLKSMVFWFIMENRLCRFERFMVEVVMLLIWVLFLVGFMRWVSMLKSVDLFVLEVFMMVVVLFVLVVKFVLFRILVLL